MCALGDYVGGCRNRRRPTRGELRATDAGEALAELDYLGGRHVEDVSVYDMCHGCPTCDPFFGDDGLDRLMGLYPGTVVEVGTLAPAKLATLGDVLR